MQSVSSVVSIGVRFAGATALAGICAALAAACGSRGPLDDEPVADASVADVQAADVTIDAEPPPATDASKPVDAGRESGTIIDCGLCLVGQCSPAILACIQSPSCINAFQCVVSDCLSGGGGAGGINPLCLFKCASGDPQGALQVLQIFQCVTGECGTDCSSVLGGLLGGGLPGGGGGGGGGTKKDGGKNLMSPPQQDFARAFSAWPQLCGPLLDE